MLHYKIRYIAIINKSIHLPKQTTRRLPVRTLLLNMDTSLAVTTYPQHHNAWVERHFCQGQHTFLWHVILINLR